MGSPALAKTRLAMELVATLINNVVSFLVFSFLDVVDVILGFVYRAADVYHESGWKPCDCSSGGGGGEGGGGILVSGRGESKVVRVSSSKLHVSDVSDTLYARSSVVSDMSKSALRRLSSAEKNSMRMHLDGGRGGNVRSSAFTVNAAIVNRTQGRIVGLKQHPTPRWSDCNCKFCVSWTSSSSKSLYVRKDGAKAGSGEEDVLFIHGFISSSTFWSETVFPKFSDSAKSKYRFFAVDLLGFGRSPRPTDSLYTLGEHIEMIEKSVLEAHKVKSFHIVAHSLGCILALALAVRHPESVKSLTLLAPPYYPVPEGEHATQYVMRRVAPRQVWPAIAFCSSIACWYEHVSRTVCLLICKNHRLWEFLHRRLNITWIPKFLLEGFFCHTHNAAWHTLHNIICGTAGKIDGYLDQIKCDINLIHGEYDELIPVECSNNVQRRARHAKVSVIEKKDHITVVVGREKEFARELEEIWRKPNRQNQSS